MLQIYSNESIIGIPNLSYRRYKLNLQFKKTGKVTKPIKGHWCEGQKFKSSIQGGRLPTWWHGGRLMASAFVPGGTEEGWQFLLRPRPHGWRESTSASFLAMCSNKDSICVSSPTEERLKRWCCPHHEDRRWRRAPTPQPCGETSPATCPRDHVRA